MTPMPYITPRTFELLKKLGRIVNDMYGNPRMLTHWPGGIDRGPWIQDSAVTVRERQAFDWQDGGGWKWIP